MSSAYWKDIIRSIWKGKKRFISIALITTLGVTMLTGITAACNDLRYSADRFFDDQELFDVQVVSTLGLEEADVEALSQVEGVEYAEGGYSETVYLMVEDAKKTAAIYTINESGINTPYLKEGHMPEAADEIVVTQLYLNESGKQIGDTIRIIEKEDESTSSFDTSSLDETEFDESEFDTSGFDSDDFDFSLDEDDSEEDEVLKEEQIAEEESISDEESTTEEESTLDEEEAADTETESLCQAAGTGDDGKNSDQTDASEDTDANFLVTEFTITGVVVDVFDINATEGTVSSFRTTSTTDYTFFISEDAITYDIYTAVYLRLSDISQLLCYSDAYNDRVAEVIDRINLSLKAERQQARYDAVIADASGQISDAEQEMNDKFLEYDQKFADAEETLADGKQALVDAEQELLDGQKELDDGKQELIDAQKDLNDGKQQLYDGQKELDDGKAQLLAGQKQLDEARQQLLSAEQELADGRKALEEAQKTIDDNTKSLQEGEAELLIAKQQLEDGEKQLDQAQTQIDQAREELEEGRQELIDGQAQLDENKPLIDAAYVILDALDEALAEAEENGSLLDQLEDVESLEDLQELVGNLEDTLEEIINGEAVDPEVSEAINVLAQTILTKLESYDGNGEALLSDIQALLSQLSAEENEETQISLTTTAPSLASGEEDQTTVSTEMNSVGISSEAEVIPAEENAETGRNETAEAEPAGNESLVDEIPGAETSGDESSVDEIPKAETSGDERSVDETTKAGTSGGESSVDETPGAETSEKESSEGNTGESAASRTGEDAGKETDESSGTSSDSSLDLERILTDQQTMSELKSLATERSAWIDLGKDLSGEIRELLDDANEQIVEGQAQIDEGWIELEAGEKQLEEAQAQIDENRAVLVEGKEQLKEAEAQLEDGRRQLEEGQKAIDENLAQLTSGALEIAEGKALLDENQKELDQGLATLASAQKKIDDGWKELNDGQKQIDDGWKDLNDGQKQIDDGWEQVTDGWQKLKDGEETLNENWILYQSKKDDALALIADAWEEIGEIDMAKWYIQKRTSLGGYANVSSDADSIDSIGTAFPFIFFVVAILISLTTVTRMVEEDRSLLGTYKALGYSNSAIRRKYELYSVLACLIGGIIGNFAGFVILPLIIFVFFGVMYALPAYVIRFSLLSGLAAILVFVGGIWLTTYLCCNKVLKEVPAQLMRPKAPSKGSRVLLERITWIWKRMSFLNKVTVRNLFRYKKRLAMTIAGIMGCTALLVIGFAIKDTVTALVDKQYNHVTYYDLVLAAESEDKLADVIGELDQDSEMIASYQVMGIESATLQGKDGNEMILQLYVFPDDGDFSDYIDLHDMDGNPLNLEVGDVFITCNAGSVLDFEAGDDITIQNLSYATADVKVDAIVQNFLGNNVFLRESTYQDIFGEEVSENALLINYSDACTDPNGYADRLATIDGVLSSVSTQSLIDTFSVAFILINLVVYVLLVMSAGLAFTVLFTLATTNISERERELATIKVLGFYDGEVHMYVNKETLILTLIGILAGLPFGALLSQCLTWILKLPSLYFDVTIFPVSYLISGGLAFGFALIVNLMTNRSLDQINPIEALKSIE